MTIAVLDAGTSSIRVVVLDDLGSVRFEKAASLPPTTTATTVEFDPAALLAAAFDLLDHARRTVGPITVVGLTNQRASAVAWHASTGSPVGPGIGWQDLRTSPRCRALRADGVRLEPNQSATKYEWLAAAARQDGTTDDDLRLGTVDTWLAWGLSMGALHVTDATNASVTGLWAPGTSEWQADLCAQLSVPVSALPRIVDTAERIGTLEALADRPVLAALVGDQQASLVGQGCLTPGAAKVTAGTGAMLDVVRGLAPPDVPSAGTFPLVAHRIDGRITWGSEAVAPTAGTCIDWIVDELGLAPSAASTSDLAASVADTDGVLFVPTMAGSGTPQWDASARGAFFGLTRGTTRAHVVRAVLEGIAAQIANLVDAAETDAAVTIETIRLDGGLSANDTFVRALAAISGRPVEVSGMREATALGAGFLAGFATGIWESLEAAVALRPPTTWVDGTATTLQFQSRAAHARALDLVLRQLSVGP